MPSSPAFLARGSNAALRVAPPLLAHVELTASELSVRLSIGLTTLLHHLALLREAGLLSAGGTRRKVYRLRREGLAELDRALTDWLE